MTTFLIRKFIKDYENTSDSVVRGEYGRLAGVVGIICNLFLFLFKLLAGILTKSVSITADAVNNLSDSASSIISLVGFRLASKPADEEHPYGHGRYEYISALTVTAIILVIGVELFKTSVSKIIAPTPIEFSIASVVILIISIFIKLWMSVFNNKTGKMINSGALLATAKDSRNDVISTLAVLISLMTGYFFHINIDGITGLLVALFIIYSSFSLLKDTLSTLLGNAPDEEAVAHIQEVIMSNNQVLGTHDLMVHDYGPGRCFASVHVEVAAEEDVLKSHDCIDNIERYFLEKENLHLIIHMDPIVTKDETVSKLRVMLSNEVKKINPAMSIHDLRIVPGETHTNVIFDCVIPPSVKYSSAEVKKHIADALNVEYKNYFAVITFEQGYAPVAK